MPHFMNPHFLLVVTSLGWAGNAVAGKYGVDHVSPMVLTFSRWLFAFLLLFVIFRRVILSDFSALRSHWLYLLLMGGFGYTAFNFCLYTALHYTSAVNVAIEQTAMPLFIFILNFLLYRLGVGLLQILGYVLTFFGVVVTATYGSPLTLLTSFEVLNRGDAIMLLGGLFYAGYSVGLSRRPSMNFVSFMAGLMLGGLVFAFFGLLYEIWVDAAVFPVTSQGLLVCAYAALVPSLISQVCFVIGVSALGSNRAGLYINLVPVFTALLVVILLIEPLQLYHLVAFLLVAGGVLLSQRRSASSDSSR